MACAWRGPDTIRFNQVSRAGASGVWSPCCLSGRDVRVTPTRLSNLARPDQKGQKDCPGSALYRRLLLLLRSKRRVAPLSHLSLRVGRRRVQAPLAYRGFGRWVLEHRDLDDAMPGPAAVHCYGISYCHNHFPEQGPAIGCGRFRGVGCWALGGAGSPPNLAPGRWVLGRRYLRKQASDLITTNGCGIAEAHTALPEERWTIGVGRSLGVGCWALGVGSQGVGCLNVTISTTVSPI